MHDADEEVKTAPKKATSPATFVGKASIAGNSMVNMGSVVPQAVPNPRQGLSSPTKRLEPTHKASPSPSPDRKRKEQAEIDAQLK